MKIKKIIIIFLLLLSFKIHFITAIEYKEEINTNEYNITKEASIINISIFIKNAGRIIGIISLLLLGFTIFIGASSRLLDLIFGLDRILRFHKKIAILSFSILLFHPMLISLANILEGINLIEFYISYLSYLPFVLGIISFSIFGLSVILTYFFFRVINHFVWLAFHRFAIVAFIFSCIHQYNLGVLSGPYSTTPAINIIGVKMI